MLSSSKQELLSSVVLMGPASTWEAPQPICHVMSQYLSGDSDVPPLGIYATAAPRCLEIVVALRLRE